MLANVNVHTLTALIARRFSALHYEGWVYRNPSHMVSAMMWLFCRGVGGWVGTFKVVLSHL